jgi:hypothetical protein
MSHQIKAAVRERDGHRCVHCGMTAEEHRQLFGANLQVHRKVPGSAYTLEGCETVCQRCHGPLPRRAPQYLSESEIGKIYEEYQTICTFYTSGGHIYQFLQRYNDANDGKVFRGYWKHGAGIVKRRLCLLSKCILGDIKKLCDLQKEANGVEEASSEKKVAAVKEETPPTLSQSEIDRIYHEYASVCTFNTSDGHVYNFLENFDNIEDGLVFRGELSEDLDVVNRRLYRISKCVPDEIKRLCDEQAQAVGLEIAPDSESYVKREVASDRP